MSRVGRRQRSALCNLRPRRVGSGDVAACLGMGAVRERWMALAAYMRLPMLAPYRGFSAMLSSGPDFSAVFRRTADFVARILHATGAADLPKEQPTQFEFVVNNRIANAAGVAIPQAALLRANEVVR